jgi:hypothetical protein
MWQPTIGQMFREQTEEELDLKDKLEEMVENGATEEETKDIRRQLMTMAGMTEDEIQDNL